jgi:hypothetical protein
VANFVTVYIREAHPTDEWQMASNETEGVCYAQPRTLEDRLRIARDFADRSHYAMPMLVDGMENGADELYAGWPERLYVIDALGRIAYKGETGPFGFDPDELEEWLSANHAAID